MRPAISRQDAQCIYTMCWSQLGTPCNPYGHRSTGKSSNRLSNCVLCFQHNKATGSVLSWRPRFFLRRDLSIKNLSELLDIFLDQSSSIWAIEKGRPPDVMLNQWRRWPHSCSRDTESAKMLVVPAMCLHSMVKSYNTDSQNTFRRWYIINNSLAAPLFIIALVVMLSV